MGKRHEDEVHPLVQVSTNSLKFGLFGGSTAAAVTFLPALYFRPNPIAFTAATGISYFCLGTVFALSRSTLLDTPVPTLEKLPNLSPLAASTASGAIAGAVCGQGFRGGRAVLPGVVVYGAMGALGQVVVNVAGDFRSSRMNASSIAHSDPMTSQNDAASSQRVSGRGQGVVVDPKHDNWVRRLSRTRWSPITEIDSNEYENRLRVSHSQILKEIETIDQEIASLKATGDLEKQSREAE
ncbi:hypothetical protein MMC25_004873 [Agyrium rufum]|nr:hypothetical protein [Agyrium rufum]